MVSGRRLRIGRLMPPKHRPSKQRMYAHCMGSVALLLAVLWLFWWNGMSLSTESPKAVSAESSVPPTDGIVREAVASMQGLVAPPGGVTYRKDEYEVVQELLQDCPTTRSMSASCIDALDRRYLDESPHLPVVAVSRLTTWRQLFENAEANRDMVLRTVEREDCTVPDLELRYDLRGECGADAIADFALLYGKCVVDMGENEHLASQDYYDLGLEEMALEFDNDLYWRKRLDLEDRRYKSAWILRKCDQMEEVAAPIQGFHVSWPEIYGDKLSWFPLPVPWSSTGLHESVFEEVWDHPRYPAVFEDALMEWSARLGAELGISLFAGDEGYNRMLMHSHPEVAYLHRAQLDINELRRTFLRDERTILERMFRSDGGPEGIALVSRFPAGYSQTRADRLIRLRRDEEVIRGHYARLAVAAAGRSGIELDEAALQAWIAGNEY